MQCDMQCTLLHKKCWQWAPLAERPCQNSEMEITHLVFPISFIKKICNSILDRDRQVLNMLKFRISKLSDIKVYILQELLFADEVL